MQHRISAKIITPNVSENSLNNLRRAQMKNYKGKYSMILTISHKIEQIDIRSLNSFIFE